ncbi:hypothetical protein ACX80D_03265 [Arthrobacter sp. Sr24]
MDLLIPLIVVLLVAAVVLIVLGKLGKARQAERTAQQYGAQSTYQPTFEDPSARAPDFSGTATISRTTAGPTTAPGSTPSPGTADQQVQEAMEAMAVNLAELLKKKGLKHATYETTSTSTSTSTSTNANIPNPMTRATSQLAESAGTHYTERSLSLTEETAGRVKALALGGKREGALALLRNEAGMDARGAELMLEMIVEQF